MNEKNLKLYLEISKSLYLNIHTLTLTDFEHILDCMRETFFNHVLLGFLSLYNNEGKATTCTTYTLHCIYVRTYIHTLYKKEHLIMVSIYIARYMNTCVISNHKIFLGLACVFE